MPAMSEAWSPMRSRSEIIFRAEEIVRRSRATGCCCSRSFMHRLSISRSLWSISRSRAAAFSALFLSASFFSVCMEAEIASSHSAPISIIS